MDVESEFDVGIAGIEPDTILRVQLLEMKRREERLKERLEKLEKEKLLVALDVKRSRDEEISFLNHRPLLNGRFQLLNLLGKGGFSEVWRALDLDRGIEVAVKVHRLNSAWHSTKKENYIKHATREHAIHKELRHANIVRYLDVFEIDHDSFATVLEYCKGMDLDRRLKEVTMLPEVEARGIVIQVLSALCHLTGCDTASKKEGVTRPKIIHFDLKPGNILFDEYMVAKVTDFGLSKIMDAPGELTSMELTSQGAGTYWYLPPECFVMSSVPRINDKVDVWSLGVIFYQMLFGKRPFGDGRPQDSIMSERLNQVEVSFPPGPKPAVSDAAKAFIKRCLTVSPDLRPDVRQLSEDPYLRLKIKGA